MSGLALRSAVETIYMKNLSFRDFSLQLKVCALLLALHSFTYAQTVHHFTRGLIVAGAHHYGREALYKDFFASDLYAGKMLLPKEGQMAFLNEKGSGAEWKAIEANSESKFKHADLVNGYLYLAYEADKEQDALLNITSNNMVYVNGTPRAGDLYGYGYLYLPVHLKKGINQFFVRGSSFSAYEGIGARLIFQDKKIFINKEDPTLPIVIAGQPDNINKRGAILLVNNTVKKLGNLKIVTEVNGSTRSTVLPAIVPMSVRKVGFDFNASSIKTKGTYTAILTLLQDNKELDRQEIKMESVSAGEDYSTTFISSIDGSTQYFSVSPRTGNGKAPALVLSVHGAGVEAINQARAYKSKDETVIVTPTNRRPRGFNWEDWGRLDAMEVLEQAKRTFSPDSQKIYLTGHSMGGHGTWYLGATFPGKWAAIAPCAGYPSLAAYGSADGKIPDSKDKTAAERLLLQASNPSNIFELAKNYNAGGIYIHHGDSDEVVSVDYARQMHQLLAGFHKDMAYHEQRGGSHWFSDESVDWAPIFDYFKWHTIPVDTAVKEIDFSTANPAISSAFHWAAIHQQEMPLKYSRIRLERSGDLKQIKGITENVARLSFSLKGMQRGDVLSVRLDQSAVISYTVKAPGDNLYLKKIAGNWELSQKPGYGEKGQFRNGTFKEPFNNKMVFVYGTKGNAAENAWAYDKVRYDAESWYYRGNGAVDIIADVDFSAAVYKDRGLILYGNANTNSAYNKLMKGCPIKISRSGISAGDRKYTGDDLAAYFIWPGDGIRNSVAVIAGTGVKGMHAADANQYFAGGSGFPDYIIFSSDILKKGVQGVKQAGFYDNNWSLKDGQDVVQ